MKIGLLWYDNDKKRPLDEKIGGACKHFLEKYGVNAKIVYVNPCMVDDNNIKGVDLRVSNSICPNYFWIGVDDEIEKLPIKEELEWQT